MSGTRRSQQIGDPAPKQQARGERDYVGADDPALLLEWDIQVSRDDSREDKERRRADH